VLKIDLDTCLFIPAYKAGLSRQDSGKTTILQDLLFVHICTAHGFFPIISLPAAPENANAILVNNFK
jgi:hypothetical protein